MDEEIEVPRGKGRKAGSSAKSDGQEVAESDIQMLGPVAWALTPAL